MTAITLAVWGSRRPAHLEILRIGDAGIASLLVGCSWPYGKHFNKIGTFRRALNAVEHSKILEFASIQGHPDAETSMLGDIVAELTISKEKNDLRLSWPPPLLPTEIQPFVEALSALACDLRGSPQAAIEVHIEREPLRLEFVHQGSEPFQFYGFDESDLGAALEVHLGEAADLGEIPLLLHNPVEQLSNPAGAHIDDTGLIELRPQEKLVIPLHGASDAGNALIRICYRRHEEDGTWFTDEGWVVASAPHPISQDKN